MPKNHFKPSIVETLQAKIALADQAGTENTQFSHEDLAALYEGRLDPAQREKALALIAENSLAYQQWMELVESRQALESLSTNEPNRLKGGLQRWLQQTWLTPQKIALGGIMASILSLAIIMYLPSNNHNLERGTEELYLAYAGQWSTEPLVDLPSRSAVLMPQWNEEQIAILHGLHEGLSSLGPAFIIVDAGSEPPAKEPQKSLSRDEYRALSSLGRLTAISHFKCQQSTQAAFFIDAKKLLLQAHKVLQDSKRAWPLQMIDSQNSQEDVCLMSQAVLGYIQSSQASG